MNIACPRKYQSFASFRLEIFRSLFVPSSTRNPPSSPKNQLRNARTQSRAFHSPTKLSKQKGSRNVEQDAELWAFIDKRLVGDKESTTLKRTEADVLTTTSHSSTDETKPDTLTPIESLTRSKRRSNRGDWRCSSCGFENFRRHTTCTQCSTPASTSTAPSHPESQNPAREITPILKRNPPWTPYSPSGQENLKDLVADLKRAATEAVDLEEEYQAIDKKNYTTVRLNLKDSPMHNMKVLKGLKSEPFPGAKRLRSPDDFSPEPKSPSVDLPESPLMRRLQKQKLHKSAPTVPQLSALSNNPWASMLASPLRHCQATGVRLPKDLLVPFSFVKRRETDATYLMPYELADMKSLRSTGFIEKSVFEGRERVDGAIGKEGSSGTRMEVYPRSPMQEGLNTYSAMAKTRILPYQPLLEKLTSRMIRGHGLGSPKGAVQRILSHRVKEKFKEAQHYSTDPEERAKFDLAALQWQPDIATRMIGIMRERVLTSLETLGGSKAARDVVQPVPLRVLQTGRADVALVTRKEGMWTCSFKPVELTPSIPHAELRQLLTERFAGSFFLHVNASATPVAIPDQPSSTLLSQAAGLLPRSISLNNTIRLPVFNLRQIMGFRDGPITSNNTTRRRYKAVLQASKALDVRMVYVAARGRSKQIMGKDREPLAGLDIGNGVPYLLFVSCQASEARSLLGELWQAWRYVGGGRGREGEGMGIGTDSKMEGVLRALEGDLQEEQGEEKMHVQAEEEEGQAEDDMLLEQVLGREREELSLDSDKDVLRAFEEDVEAEEEEDVQRDEPSLEHEQKG